METRQPQREIWFRCYRYGSLTYGNAYPVHWKGYVSIGALLSACLTIGISAARWGNLGWACLGFFAITIPCIVITRPHLEIVDARRGD